LREVLFLSIEASLYNLFFFVGLVVGGALSFIEKTEELPEILEFFITLFSIPMFVFLYLLNSFVWFIFCYALVYVYYGTWGPIFIFILKLFWFILDLIDFIKDLFNFPEISYHPGKELLVTS